MSTDSRPPASPTRLAAPAALVDAPQAPQAPVEAPAVAFAHLTQALGPAGADAWLDRLMDGGTPDLAAQVALSAALSAAGAAGPEQSLRVQAVLASTLTVPQRAALERVGLDPGRHGPAFDAYVRERGFRSSAILAAVSATDVQSVLDMAASAYAAGRA